MEVGKKWKHCCLYHSNCSGFSLQYDLAMSSFTSTFLLLSHDPNRSSSISSVTKNPGRFGIPVDRVVKNVRECSTAGQTKELINHTYHHICRAWKQQSYCFTHFSMLHISPQVMCVSHRCLLLMVSYLFIWFGLCFSVALCLAVLFATLFLAHEHICLCSWFLYLSAF